MDWDVGSPGTGSYKKNSSGFYNWGSRLPYQSNYYFSDSVLNPLKAFAKVLKMTPARDHKQGVIWEESEGLEAEESGKHVEVKSQKLQ